MGLSWTAIKSDNIDNEEIDKKVEKRSALAVFYPTHTFWIFQLLYDCRVGGFQEKGILEEIRYALIGIYRHPIFAEIIDITSDNEALYLLTKSKILRFVKIFEGE